jgi:hypothetical protein
MIPSLNQIPCDLTMLGDIQDKVVPANSKFPFNIREELVSILMLSLLHESSICKVLEFINV